MLVGGKLSTAGEKMKTKVSAIMVLLVISKSAFNSDDRTEPNNRVMNDG